MASRRAPRGLRTSKFIEKSMKIKDYHKIPYWSYTCCQPGSRTFPKAFRRPVGRPNGPPRQPRGAPAGLQSLPRGLQEASRCLLEPSKKPPARCQEAPRGPNRPQDASRRLPGAPRHPKEAPRDPPKRPRALQQASNKPPRPPQRAFSQGPTAGGR